MNKELLQLLDGAEDKYPHTLEQQFPHVFNKILELWGLPAINQYFVDLMLHTRAVPRKGFPPKAAKEILDLSLINDEQTKAKEGTLIGR
ncbi:hypothetical protein [Candidatus Nitrotoga sp. 1052]|uniref:hypothetical protein n=1 Tax=Candidatus Nitrotoga sp. 1052 TaxID=2886964 RepID=UPI001EF5ACFC|nr:hypothetical protein [Candidatus Nitrotoga sp. 1052]CAH1072459.1 conserved hypothetical protein [Candidatus Nitrotoga sp. 1052]